MPKVARKELDRTPRRVRSNDVKSREWAKPGGLEDCLECWKKFMAGDERDLSASRMRLSGGADDPDDPARNGYESNPYDEQWKADLKVGEATGIMIDGLKPCWRWAIYKKCSVSDVWNFPKLNFMDVIVDAEADLEIRLRKNIATGTKF